MNTISYLALGDSYTIGEQVMITESFPYQAIELARRKKMAIYAPEIVAKTGWTSDELSAAIDQRQFLPSYDRVSLLIGVNNQYRGRGVQEFTTQFDHLVQRALAFAGNITAHVTVLSIPDWGVTPFAEGRDRKAIATEIDAFNAVCKEAALRHGTNYIDITIAQRKDNGPDYIAPDGLHPSGKEYAKWAALLVGKFSQSEQD